MKELSIEEKARAYDEAFRIAQELYNDPNSSNVGKGYVYTIFHEVKENEDERIRKALISRFNESGELDGISYDNIKIWLEKQGEQNPIDYENATIHQKDFAPNDEEMKELLRTEYEKGRADAITEMQDEQKTADTVEHKFEIGDWVVFNNKHQSIYQVEKIEDGYYILRHTHGGTFRVCVLHNKSLRHWTIQDAKDGDVLAYVTDEEDLWIMIYWSLYEPYEGHIHYHALLVNDDFFDKGTCCICIDDLKPATKEQRDTLMKAMADAGYTFDFEKKELKKIEDEIEIPFGAKDSELQEASYHIPEGFHAEVDGNKVIIKKGEQKPVWSEEDEDMHYKAMAVINRLYAEGKDYVWSTKTLKKLFYWLKSLKDRVQPQNKWKPSEEMLEALYRATPENVMEKSEDEMLLDKLYQGLKYGKVLSKK